MMYAFYICVAGVVGMCEYRAEDVGTFGLRHKAIAGSVVMGALWPLTAVAFMMYGIVMAAEWVQSRWWPDER